MKLATKLLVGSIALLPSLPASAAFINTNGNGATDLMFAFVTNNPGGSPTNETYMAPVGPPYNFDTMPNNGVALGGPPDTTFTSTYSGPKLFALSGLTTFISGLTAAQQAAGQWGLFTSENGIGLTSTINGATPTLTAAQVTAITTANVPNSILVAVNGACTSGSCTFTGNSFSTSPAQPYAGASQWGTRLGLSSGTLQYFGTGLSASLTMVSFNEPLSGNATGTLYTDTHGNAGHWTIINAGTVANPNYELQYAINAAAVPEPGGLALLISGLGVIGLIARRRLS